MKEMDIIDESTLSTDQMRVVCAYMYEHLCYTTAASCSVFGVHVHVLFVTACH